MGRSMFSVGWFVCSGGHIFLPEDEMSSGYIDFRHKGST